MTRPRIAGFSIIRNATLLDFPLEASILSVLPAVSQFVLAVGRSEDDTLDRVRALMAQEPKLKLIETEWDFSRGSLVLSQQTDLALQACDADWGIYIQADEVLQDGGAEKLARLIEKVHARGEVEGVIVDYLHFYGGLDRIAVSRRWYRREVRAIRLDVGVHSHGDAQGFRVGESERRVRCVSSGVKMFHYGWARPEWVLRTKRNQDRTIYATEQRKDPDRPLLPWMPGMREFTGEHPRPVQPWVKERRGGRTWVEPRHFEPAHLRVWFTMGIERLTGWRPFEYRNYTLVR